MRYFDIPFDDPEVIESIVTPEAQSGVVTLMSFPGSHVMLTGRLGLMNDLNDTALKGYCEGRLNTYLFIEGHACFLHASSNTWHFLKDEGLGYHTDAAKPEPDDEYRDVQKADMQGFFENNAVLAWSETDYDDMWQRWYNDKNLPHFPAPGRCVCEHCKAVYAPVAFRRSR